MAEPLHSGALAALGDANRRAIVEILARGPRSVQQIADELPVSRPAVSRHLRLLKDAGLVCDEPVGPRRLYTLRGRASRRSRRTWRRCGVRSRPGGNDHDRAIPRCERRVRTHFARFAGASGTVER